MMEIYEYVNPLPPKLYGSGVYPNSEFMFIEPFESNSENGLYMNGIYFPEEIITKILSYIPSKDVLKLTQVCKKWSNIIKSEHFWMDLYNKSYPTKAKRLPWFVYYCLFATNNFDENLLKNGNGQDDFNNWIMDDDNGEDNFKVENTPYSNSLPLNVPEFNGYTSCFTTNFSYCSCSKMQIISLKNKRLLQYILNKYRPAIYVSEWVNVRPDYKCVYRLTFRGYDKYFHQRDLQRHKRLCNDNSILTEFAETQIGDCQDGSWKKVELLIKKYFSGVAVLVFEHEAMGEYLNRLPTPPGIPDHYGSSMAGGVVRILFDSIQPLEME